MGDGGNILGISVIVIGLISGAFASYKTGFLSYSPQSYLKGGKPKFTINKPNVGKFVGLVLLALLLNALYVAMFTREVEAVAIFSGINTAFITYALIYWVLLKEKKS